MIAKPMAAVLAGLLLLAGCSDDGDASGDDTAETPTPSVWEPTPGLCDVLSGTQPAELLVVDDPSTLKGPRAVNEGRGCIWIDRRNPEVQLILVAIPTQEWVTELPAAIEAQLAIPGLPADQRADLESIRAEVGTLSADESDNLCDLFSRLAEVQGHPEGSSTAVYVTRGTAGLSAQHCEGDTFTSLTGRSNRIGDSRPMLAAYEQAVEEAAAAR